MVFCVIAIIIFGILGLFSAKYRTYFREALRCVGRQATLRKCDTDFDNKIKSKITAKLMGKSPSTARFVYKRFYLISWVFVILLFWSAAIFVTGIYNFYSFGNCNGPGAEGFCIFDTMSDIGYSVIGGISAKDLIPASADDDPFLGGENAKVTIIEFGCFRCSYTKEFESTRKQLLEKYNNSIKFVFRNFPLPQHNLSRETAEASNCALEQGKYWEYHNSLFDNQKNMSIEIMKKIAIDIGANAEQFNQCFDSKKFKDEVEKDYQDGLKSKLYGTPTFFINGRALVGPKPIGEFIKIIDEELGK